jgi:hypothetical protein
MTHRLFVAAACALALVIAFAAAPDWFAWPQAQSKDVSCHTGMPYLDSGLGTRGS